MLYQTFTDSVITCHRPFAAFSGSAQHAGPLPLVNLGPLLTQSIGRAEIAIGLIDGPVATDLPHFSTSRIRAIPGRLAGACASASSIACMHGTLVAGVLSARRGTDAPAICPGCTLLVRPIFPETKTQDLELPGATPEELATAIVDCVDASAHIINLSAAIAHSSAKGERLLQAALDYCGRRNVIVVAASGNQGIIGSSSITRHPWVIPVVACDLRGQPINYSNLGSSIGRRGLSAPGAGVTSLGTDGKPHAFAGTSAAAPFVTGTVALLRSEFPDVPAAKIRFALMQGGTVHRTAIVPKLLDAWSSYQILKRIQA